MSSAVGAIDYNRFLDCIHCGLCLSSCPTYEMTGMEMDGPRGRIHLMRAVTDGRLKIDDAVRTHLDLCLNCRACETACPSGVQYHQILEPFRDALSELSPRKPLPWLHRFAMRSIFPYRRRVRAALAPLRMFHRTAATLVKALPRSARSLFDNLPPLSTTPPALPEYLPAIGKRRARVALFLGCVADGVYPHTNVATARVLQHNGCDVWIPKSQTCCGALDYHDCQTTRASSFAIANLNAFGFGSIHHEEPDAIISNAAGCGTMLKDYAHVDRETDFAEPARKFASKVRDICEFLDDLEMTPPTQAVPMKATYHDACHLRHGQKIFDQPRRLLGSIPGLQLIPLPESELCCGAAGSYNLTQPEMSAQLGQRKAERIAATGADVVLTGNVGCLMQIARHLRHIKPNLRVMHPVDVLWQSYGGQT